MAALRFDRYERQMYHAPIPADARLFVLTAIGHVYYQNYYTVAAVV